jgi:sulfur carrier protein
MTISLTVNGKKRELDGETDLPSFLRTLEVDPRMVAVAYNGDVIPRDEYPRIRLHEGDTLEVVRMVGGGASGS